MPGRTPRRSISSTTLDYFSVTQADLDNGSIADSAVANATSPTGGTLTSDTAAATVPVIQSPAISVLKTAVPTTVSAVGETITYTFVLTNTGNVTLTDLKVHDTRHPGRRAHDGTDLSRNLTGADRHHLHRYLCRHPGRHGRRIHRRHGHRIRDPSQRPTRQLQPSERRRPATSTPRD